MKNFRVCSPFIASLTAVILNFREASISSRATHEASSSTKRTTALSSSASSGSSPAAFDRLQMLLSLDAALELIHADREALKRVETFQYYPGHYGHKVRETIEELFIILLQTLGDRHIRPGFAQCVYSLYSHTGQQEIRSLLIFIRSQGHRADAYVQAC